jgi:phospholipid methyltransferase
MERAQNYLVVRGPYQFTRNPMYLCGMLIWLGWIIFYGGVSVGAFAVVFWGCVTGLVMPWEERNLEARFGEAYLRYKNSVPRCWARGAADVIASHGSPETSLQEGYSTPPILVQEMRPTEVKSHLTRFLRTGVA